MTTTTDTAPDRLADDIIRVSATEWFVRSKRSAPGAYWRVQTADPAQPPCGCPAGRDVPLDEALHSRACRHLSMAVRWEIARDRLAHPRPIAKPNVSALVD
jgi:hypothetical protein